MLFVLSSIPGNSYPTVRVPFADKMVHGLLYLPLGILLARAVDSFSSLKRAAWAIIVGCAYGATDEWHQLLVPKRSCDFQDWFADSIAVCLGVVVWSVASKRMRKTA